MADPEKALNSEGNEADIEDMEDFDDSEEGKYVQQLLNSNIGGLAIDPELYVKNLPKPTKRLLKALKKSQLECTKLEAEFYKEVHSLECKYASLYKPLFDKRCQIVTGMMEPTNEDCDFPSDVDTDDEQMEELQLKLKINMHKENFTLGDLKGIPAFWLTVLKNVSLVSEMIQPHDEPILECLDDIVVKLSEAEPMGFTLEFHFKPNEYFNNSVLIKEYEMTCSVDDADPFSFDGPEIFKCKGCTINWKPGKDVTVKTIKKKQKHKQSGSVRTVMKTMLNDSFFNFFNPPTLSPGQEMDEDTQALLSADFEIGHFIRERLVPRAVLYFTGEALDDFDEDLDVEDEEEDIEAEDEFEELNVCISNWLLSANDA